MKLAKLFSRQLFYNDNARAHARAHACFQARA